MILDIGGRRLIGPATEFGEFIRWHSPEAVVIARRRTETMAVRDLLCRCNKCGVTRRCVPEFDFYISPEGYEDIDRWLYCEPCMKEIFS